VRTKFILCALRTESLNKKYFNCCFLRGDNPCEIYRFEASNEKILLNGFVNMWKEKYLEYLAALFRNLCRVIEEDHEHFFNIASLRNDT
jgi:hypothetical protein